MPRKESFIYNLRPIHRSLISLAAGIASFFIFASLPVLLRLMIGWLGFAVIYNILCWIVIAGAPVSLIKSNAGKEDGSKTFVFTMILLGTFASLFAALMLMISDQRMVEEWVIVSVAVSSMLLSWFLVHTVFTFHYAHEYYEEGGEGDGLDFPGDEDPDYMDFAYFSFVIGCTFQVSDVEITDRQIRRTVLFHGLLSFLLNTFVVALTINIIAGLMK